MRAKRSPCRTLLRSRFRSGWTGIHNLCNGFRMSNGTERQYQLVRELLEQVATRQDLANLRRELAVAIEGLTAAMDEVLAELAKVGKNTK